MPRLRQQKLPLLLLLRERRGPRYRQDKTFHYAGPTHEVLLPDIASLPHTHARFAVIF